MTRQGTLCIQTKSQETEGSFAFEDVTSRAWITRGIRTLSDIFEKCFSMVFRVSKASWTHGLMRSTMDVFVQDHSFRATSRARWTWLITAVTTTTAFRDVRR